MNIITPGAFASFVYSNFSPFKVFFIIIFIISSILHADGQCAVAVEPGSFQLISEGGCNYHISVRTSKTNGNPSAQVYWGCGNAAAATTPLICISGWPSNNVFKTDVSGTITCNCSGNIYAKITAWTNTSCGGSSCNLVSAQNLAITLSEFVLNTSENGNEVCLSWNLKNPDLQNQYLVEGSTNGIKFERVNAFTNYETYKSNGHFGICLKNKLNHKFFRLNVIEPDGSITFSPIRKIDFLKTDLTVSVDRNHNRLIVFGLDHQDVVPYHIINIYGQIISKGQLNATSLELPSISSGMYILKLNLPSKEVPLTWIY